MSCPCPFVARSLPLVLACALGAACGEAKPSESHPEEAKHGAGTRAEGDLDPTGAGPVESAPEGPDPYADYPLYGLVTGTQLTIHQEPDPDSLVMGWLRRGELIRLKTQPVKTPTCNTGWYALHPKGFACAGVGIQTQDAPFDLPPDQRAQANRAEPLPYAYYFVKDHRVAEYHQLPSRALQRIVAAYTARWGELNADEAHPRALERFLAGEAKGEPGKPTGVRRYLDRGFFVASTGIEVRDQRRFVRTVRGTYVKEAHLLRRESPSFTGVVLDETTQLPVAWAVRSGPPLVPVEKWDGEIKWHAQENAEVIERLTPLPQWKRRTNIGGKYVHELEGEVYLRDWFVAVARRIDPPRRTRSDEPWVHVDLASQTLVLYTGKQPVFATLISSGLPDHETPAGEYHIMRKYISDTMADIGADAENDRYRIEDVPWTQYFSGSLALHGAFWHDRFGMRRSHGCVNISPPDAQRVFAHTLPRVPRGWHGAAVFKTGFRSSKVLITE